MGTQVTIIGVDCATELSKTAVACGLCDGGELREVRLAPLRRRGGIRETPALLAEHVRGLAGACDGSVLLALDAPLGWPAAMHTGLPRAAGEAPAEVDADKLFRRATDLAVEARIGRRVLEVGANLIARTAFVALRLLECLREDESWELAWTPQSLPQRSCIEVYPAGTVLTVRPEDGDRLLTGYKKSGSARDALAKALAVREPALAGLATRSDHELDALVAVMAGARFLRGEALGPEGDAELSRAEGWIWL